jgi:hypothetical protein
MHTATAGTRWVRMVTGLSDSDPPKVIGEVRKLAFVEFGAPVVMRYRLRATLSG